MYYGDQQSQYTNLRASFGAYGGAVASGAYMSPGMGMGGPGQPTGAVDGLAYLGAQVRPITYMPPARVYMAGTGMYQQESLGFWPSIARAVGYMETPRNVATADYRMNAAYDASERLATGLSTAAIGLGGTFIAGAATASIGSAVGGFVGMGAGGLLGAPFGAAGVGVGAWAGRGIGSVVGGMAGGMAGMQVASDIVDMVAQQRQMRNYLETASFRSVTASSGMADMRRGQGMGTGARAAVTEMITQMDIADPMMDMNDLTRTLQGAMGMGLMNNVQSVDDFKKRFKDITENLKLVVRTMNTTLEEGLKTMQEFRGIGVNDPTSMGAMVLKASVGGRIAGLTTQEMVGLGMQGAEMFRGTGVAMNVGYQSMVNNVAAIRASRDAGLLSQEAVAQAGGVEALAQRMTAGSLSFTQTGLGRGMGAAFFQPGTVLNQGDMQSYLLGQGPGFVGIAQQAASNLASPGRMMEFQAKQPQFLSKLGSMMGGEGLQMYEMQSIMSMAQFHKSIVPGIDMETAFRYSAQSLNKSEPEIEAMLARMRNAGGEFGARQRSAEVERDRMSIEQSYQNFFYTRFKERYISDPYKAARNLIAEPVNRWIDSVAEGSKGFFEEQFLGVERASLGGINTGVGRASSILDEIRRGPGKAKRSAGEINLDEAGWFASSSGEIIHKSITGGNLARGLGVDVRSSTRAVDGVVLNTSPLPGGARQYITHADAAKLADTSAVFRMTSADAAGLAESGGASYKETERRIQQAAVQYDLDAMDFSSAMKALTGKDLANVTREEYAAVINTLGGQTKKNPFAPDRFADRLQSAREEAQTYASLQGNISVKSMQQLQKSYDSLRGQVSKKFSHLLKGKQLTAGVLEQVAAAGAEGKTAEEKEQYYTEAAFLLAADLGISTAEARVVVGQLAGEGASSQAADSVRGLLNEGEVSKIAQISSIYDMYKSGAGGGRPQIEQVQNMIKKAAVRSGRSITDKEAREAALGFLDKGMGINNITGDVGGLLSDVRAYQSTEGLRARKEQLMGAIAELRGPEEAARRLKLEAAAARLDSPEALLEMSSSEADELTKAGFSDIAAPAKALSRMRVEVKELAANPTSATAKQALKESLAEFSKQNKLGFTSGDVDHVLGEVASGKGSAVLTTLARDTMRSLAPTTGITGGAGGGLATQTGTAQEAYETQTRINRTILQALETLAQDLARK